MSKRYDAVIIGGGHNGLVAACYLARAGFDVWTMDHDGYGRSGSSGNNSDIASGVEDLTAAMPVVMRETGQSKLHLYGASSGAIRAGAFAQVAPERVARLVLVAFTYRGAGAPEIARHCGEVFIIAQHDPRAFVPRVDFVTSFGYGEGGDHRRRLGFATAGPTLIVTDLCLMRPDPGTKELTVTSIHPGVRREQITERTGWPVRFAASIDGKYSSACR